jgi:hypothetical protein
MTRHPSAIPIEASSFRGLEDRERERFCSIEHLWCPLTDFRALCSRTLKHNLVLTFGITVTYLLGRGRQTLAVNLGEEGH